ncbi:MAG: hypothetical protein IJI57_11555 [Flexilinea sp.]|nr:hypothetical protein [Flexilinea sp.]
MRNIWDHLALVLYAVGIILACMFFAFVNEQNESLPDFSPSITKTAETMPAAADVPSYTAEPSFHRPVRTVDHEYTFDAMSAEAVPASDGMLTLRDITGSSFYYEPSGDYQHVYHEETGLYDCFIYGIGTVGDLDTYAKYIFRYDSRTGKAASFVQEQYIDTGTDMSPDHLAVYAENTGNLLEAVFSGMDFPLDTDKRVIEELALYFFSSHIPGNPSVPAVLHFQMPAYVLTFVMDTDVFITIISPDKLPAGYTVEKETD